MPAPKLAETYLEDIDKQGNKGGNYFRINPSPRHISNILGPEASNNNSHREQNHTENVQTVSNSSDPREGRRLSGARPLFWPNYRSAILVHSPKSKCRDKSSKARKMSAVCARALPVLQGLWECSGCMRTMSSIAMNAAGIKMPSVRRCVTHNKEIIRIAPQKTLWNRSSAVDWK